MKHIFSCIKFLSLKITVDCVKFTLNMGKVVGNTVLLISKKTFISSWELLQVTFEMD